VNEAAASGLPLLVSRSAGCAATLVPDPEGSTGARFDPLDVEDLAAKLSWMATAPREQQATMGRRASETVSYWGPDRFARAVVEAIEWAHVLRLQRRAHAFPTAMGAR
jgi:glycosyltransferase involved in cell wall biosynthesis